MKIVVKEISTKNTYLIYLMDSNNKPLECKILNEEERTEYREELINRYYPNVVGFEDFTYLSYLKQDDVVITK